LRNVMSLRMPISSQTTNLWFTLLIKSLQNLLEFCPL
jgi:hypothetical protein